MSSESAVPHCFLARGRVTWLKALYVGAAGAQKKGRKQPQKLSALNPEKRSTRCRIVARAALDVFRGSLYSVKEHYAALR